MKKNIVLEKVLRKIIIKALNEGEYLKEESSFEYNVWKSPINGERGTIKLNGKTIAYIKSNSELEVEEGQENSELLSWWDSVKDEALKPINESEEILEEGLKETIATAALSVLLATAPFSSILAQKNSDGVLKKIQDKNTKELVAKKVSEVKGIPYETILNRIEANAKAFEKEAKKGGEVKTKTVSDEKDVYMALRDGYSIAEFNEFMKLKPAEANAIVIDVDSIYPFGSDDMFKTGEYTLTPAAIADLTNIAKSIENSNSIVNKITIESSTDTEPISMGNEELAKLRANSIKEKLVSLGISSDVFEVVTKPNSGPNVYSRTMSDSERENKRKETAEFRYVKLTVDTETHYCVTQEPEYSPEKTYEKSFNLVKAVTAPTKIKPPKPPKIISTTWKTNTIKCPNLGK